MIAISRRWMQSLTIVFACFGLACGAESAADADTGADAAADTLAQSESVESPMEVAVAESDEGEGEHGSSEGEGEHARAEGGEHDGERGGEDGGEGHDEGGEGEESGVYIAIDDTWDTTRRGARLILSFDATDGAFRGTVENTTEAKLCAVRVEVHLSTGKELGPTPVLDLESGQTIQLILPVTEKFETWTAHPETSACVE